MLIVENDMQTFIQYITSCPDLHKLKDKDTTLLQVAAKYDRPKFVLWLLQYMNTDADNIKSILLDLAQIAVSIDSIPVLEIILGYSPEFLSQRVNSPDQVKRSTLLHKAVEQNSEEMVRYLCSHLKTDVNLTDSENRRADELSGATKEIKKIIKDRRWM